MDSITSNSNRLPLARGNKNTLNVLDGAQYTRKNTNAGKMTLGPPTFVNAFKFQATGSGIVPDAIIYVQDHLARINRIEGNI